MNHDPQEDDPQLKMAFAAADREADEELAENSLRGEMGFCHVFWETKKRILREKYGIRWQSPPDMNPIMLFD